MNQFSKAAVDAAIAAAEECDKQQLTEVFENHKDELVKLAAEPSGRTPLHDACCVTGNSTWVKALLTLIPNHAEKKNGSGLSPLHIAAAQGDVEIAKELVEGRPHLCLLKGPNDRIPLHYAIENGKVEVMQELLSVSPESVEETTARKETGLHLAVKQCEAFVELVKHLKKEKKKHVINWKDDQGNTALHLAVAVNNSEMVEFMGELLSVSPESVEETTARKETGLHLAVKNGQDKAFFKLVDHLKLKNKEHVINWKDDQGNTALHLAVADKNSKVLEFMRDEHAKGNVVVAVNAHNNCGQTPLDFVGRKGEEREKIIGILNALGAKHGGEPRADIRNALLVVAGLIASTTYQAVLQPPHFKTKVDETLTEGFHASYVSYMTGFFGRDLAYIVFITGNTFGFLVSIQMIIYLTRDLSVKLPMFLSMALMVQTYYCHTYYLPFVKDEKEFGLKNVELLSVLPLTIPILLLLIQTRLAEGLEFYLGKLSLFDHQRDMYDI